MSKDEELKTLAKGYMALKKALKEKEDKLEQLNTANEIVTDLSVQGSEMGTDVKLFLSRANDKLVQQKEIIEKTETEKNALQSSLAKISVELNNAQLANTNLGDENAKLKELVAQSKADMYKMMHEESKENLQELAQLKIDNMELKTKLAETERKLADMNVMFAYDEEQNS